MPCPFSLLVALACALKLGWYLNEIGCVVLIFGLTAGLISGAGLDKSFKWSVEGTVIAVGVALLGGLSELFECL